MSFYDLPEEERKILVAKIYHELENNIVKNDNSSFLQYFSDKDTYIRKASYVALGRLYTTNPTLHQKIIHTLNELFASKDELVRQTVVNAFGEIGKVDTQPALDLFRKALLDPHHKVRNAVIGSLKKMGQVNSLPTISFAQEFLHHPNEEVRRQVVHGIELRGRTHPEEVLPLLAELQDETKPRVRNMVIHVIGQISYKQGCLEKVLHALKGWENKKLVEKALEEIVETHHAYANFSYYTPSQAERMIKESFQVE